MKNLISALKEFFYGTLPVWSAALGTLAYVWVAAYFCSAVWTWVFYNQAHSWMSVPLMITIAIGGAIVVVISTLAGLASRNFLEKEYP